MFSELKEIFSDEAMLMDISGRLKNWVQSAQMYIDSPRYPKNDNLAKYIEQEKDKIEKTESYLERIGLYRELIGYIVSHKSQIQNPLFQRHVQDSYIPYGKFNKENNSIEWEKIHERHSISEEISQFVASLFKRVKKFNVKLSEYLTPSFIKLTDQSTLVHQYIKHIENLISEENLSGLSLAERKQVLFKLNYIQEITAAYKEDVQNFFYLPMTRSRLLTKLYQVKKLQQEIDRKKSNSKNGNENESVEKDTHDKKSKFGKAKKILSYMTHFVIDGMQTLGGSRIARLMRSAGDTENCYYACMELINRITGQQELVEEYLNLVHGLASVENWDVLTPEQKLNIRLSLDHITNEAVVYKGAVVAVKPFDPTVPLSKSIMETKIQELGKVVGQVEIYIDQLEKSER